MLILGIAENRHDSCISFIDNGTPICHVELERITRVKRDVFRSPDQAMRLVEYVRWRFDLPHPDLVAVVKHAVQGLTPAIVRAMQERFPQASVVYYDHLDAHAGLALAAFPDAQVLAVDGGGDGRVAWGSPNAYSIVMSEVTGVTAAEPIEFTCPPIDGRAWVVLSHHLFNDLHAAGKVMGLAGHAADPEQYRPVMRRLVRESLDWRYDAHGLARLCRSLPSPDLQTGADLAASLQLEYTDALVSAAQAARGQHRPLVVVGGCALNVLTNSRLREALPTREVWVPPCPGDEGVSLGAAFLASAVAGVPREGLTTPFLGLGDDDGPMLTKQHYAKAADLLASGQVLAVAVGRSEIGPRALGNRSFLCLPTAQNKTRVSEVLKARESFRPVAPAMLAEETGLWLSEPSPSPFMSFSAIASSTMLKVGPGAVHVDDTVRYQTVGTDDSPHLRCLLSAVGSRTGASLLINTSLNVAGEPLVQDPADAARLCLGTGVDALLHDSGLLRFRL